MKDGRRAEDGEEGLRRVGRAAPDGMDGGRMTASKEGRQEEGNWDCPNCGSTMEESNYHDVMIYLWCNGCCECHPLEERGEKFEGWEVMDEKMDEEALQT